MKASVLEFKLLENVFCFNTELIEYVFELESFNEVKGFHESVVGVTRYNEDMMLLIDSAKLYSGKELDFSKELSVIVIKDEAGMHYGMIVDLIIKIEELESVSATVNLNTKDMVINHYKEKDGDDIVNEIHPLPLLEKYDIPAMASLALKQHQEDQRGEESVTNYLLFKIAGSSFAIESSYVREVLENENEVFRLANLADNLEGAIAVRDEVISLVELKKTENANDILVLFSGDKKVAIGVDEVYDIENFIDTKIEPVLEAKSAISAFYNYNGDVVAIVDPHFYFQEMTTVTQNHNEEKSELIHTKFDYLIFMLDGKKYSIEMKYVRQVLESDSLVKTQSSSIVSNQDVACLATWNRHPVAVLKLDNRLDLHSEDNDMQTIIIEYKEQLVAFMVQDIDNIVYLGSSEISRVRSEKEALINGAIVYNNEVIVTLNPAYLVQLG